MGGASLLFFLYIEPMVIVRIFDTMSACTESEVQRLARLLPKHRVEQALRYKHLFGQFACLQTYAMLLDLGLPETPFLFNEHGKPYLPDGPYFSISHCKHALAVCVGEQPVGIDIESIRRADESLIRRTMNEQEQRLIANAGEDSLLQFTALWTRKEAVLKYLGTGIIDDLHTVLETVPEGIEIQTYLPDKKPYAWTIVHRKNEEIHVKS